MTSALTRRSEVSAAWMTRFDRVPRAMNATQSSTPGRNETREDRPMTADLYPVQGLLVTSKTQASWDTVNRDGWW